jgi:murein tripeptide amidase MpaA
MKSDFRQRYLNFAELTATLEGWAKAYPDITRLQSIGKTAEGRDLWLLTIGSQPDETKPTVWIDGNMHAAELCGSSVALAIAEDIINLHASGAAPQGMSAPVCDALREVHFYVLPRISPDGAEVMLGESRFVRSNLRDDRPDKGRSYWRNEDVDGNGRVLAMRVEDATGEFVESAEVPNLLLPRDVDDEGPFYKAYPEGVIENFDGRNIPTPHFLGDKPNDLNRNFPWCWAPEPDEIGAGSFPGSEPESRAIIEFTSARPHIFAWLNLHTFGGVGIRPLGNQPDNKMDQEDLAIYRQVGHWLESATGYPMVNGFEEFTYEPEKPIHGDITDYAYHQRGCIAYVVELWDLFAQAGLEIKRPFIKNYLDMTRQDLEAIGRWDRQHNAGRAFVEWRKFEHPQLGTVEIGGVDSQVGLWNPSFEKLAEICEQQSAAFLRVAALAPRVNFANVTTETLADDLTRVEFVVENRGYLSSSVLSSARKLPWNEAPYLELDCEGCTIVEGSTKTTLGHLDGWGRGLGSDLGVPHLPWGKGSTSTAKHSVVIRGSGTVTAAIKSCRIGSIQKTLSI